MKRAFMSVAVITALCLGSIEVMLRVVDPWGVNAYFGDIHTLAANYAPDSQRSYHLADGRYQFRHWQATVTQGTRDVPETSEGECVLVFVGDSVTFGHGVNDGETFVNLLARAMPDVQMVNAGVNGYNAQDIQATVEAIPGNGYVYLLNANDADAAYQLDNPPALPSLATGYLGYIAQRLSGSKVHADELPIWISPVLDALARPDLLAVGFDTWFSDYASGVLDVQIIPDYTERISVVDPHPTATGHRQIAESMRPLVAAFAEAVCR